MRIAVTGATGFLGSAVVRAAVRADCEVIALVRPGREGVLQSSNALSGVTVVGVALEDVDALGAALQGCDAVIHTAAAKSGTYEEQYQTTVVTTQTLCAALRVCEHPHLVGISSFSVFDYERLRAGDLLDEDAPIASHIETRDAYAKAKIKQEECFNDYANEGGQVSVLRPGIIYGRGQLWQFCLGHGLGSNFWVQLGPPASELPLVYVDNCADAAVCAAQSAHDGIQIVNIVDDDRPGRDEFIAKLNAFPALRKNIVRMPWHLWFSLARLITTVNERLFAGRLPVPGLLRPSALNARFKPLRYSNQRAKRLFGWRSNMAVDEALESSASV